MNRIVFCLYGSNPTYNVGLIRNLQSLHAYFSKEHWRPLVVTDWVSLAPETAKALHGFGRGTLDVIDVRATVYKDRPGHFWRFASFTWFPLIEDPDCVVLFQDADSRINERGFQCFDSWIRKSVHPLFTILDHPGHDRGIALGNFGVNVGMAKKIGFFDAIEATMPAWLANVPAGARRHDGEISDEIYFRECLLAKFSRYLWVDDFRSWARSGNRVKVTFPPKPYDGPFIGEQILLDACGCDIPTPQKRAQRAASFRR